ncbi:MAG: GMC family oxidoreductase [Acidobacteria bacterium]|nr:MAG: GMC family oxidoreductase [Acidobacteriota bacterium]REK04534.1 MAG: GMC family oxidoreductase [Acidobacteriota bacterium]
MPQKVYDAIVVGSGANGGWAAKQLCEAGMEVVMLEAGRKLDPATDFSEHTMPWELPLRGRQDPRNPLLERRPVGKRCYACGETNAHFFIDEVDNPITTEEGKPFWWIRGNQVGGRTILWGRQSYRMSDWDFKAASRDGFGDDWPISYADLEPYYDEVERFIGVSGRREGIEVLPDGQFLPPMAYTCGEIELEKGLQKMGRRMTIGRAAVLTRRHNGRAACHYCGPCHFGCRTGSYFSSPVSTLPAAEATGKFTLVPNARAWRVLMDDENRAKGVIYHRTEDGETEEVFAKVVVLAASTLASTRILLNSKSDEHPDGLANSSGVLGCYLMDHHFVSGANGVLPKLEGQKPEQANRPNGIYIPRFKNLRDPASKSKQYLRGYGFQGGENVTIYEHAASSPGFGAEWKHAMRSANVHNMNIGGWGEMLPRKENRVRLDPEVKDKWGVPVLEIDCAWSDNEKAMSKDIAEEAQAMLEAAGCEDVVPYRVMPPPGFCIHEVGTARMGEDPGSSVVNSFQQTHDVRNLFVMDGSSFVTIGCVNPTLTMMALTVRSSEYLADRYAKGELV